MNQPAPKAPKAPPPTSKELSRLDLIQRKYAEHTHCTNWDAAGARCDQDGPFHSPSADTLAPCYCRLSAVRILSVLTLKEKLNGN